MKPPTSRYRIVERDRKLVTVDTWAEGSDDADNTSTLSEAANDRILPESPNHEGTRQFYASAISVPGLIIPGLFGWHEMLEGRALTTHGWYDAAAPRIVYLTYAMVVRLTHFIATAAKVTLMLLAIGFWSSPWLLPTILVALVIAIRSGFVRSVITPWVDLSDQPDVE
jgi:hypothetical protein